MPEVTPEEAAQAIETLKAAKAQGIQPDPFGKERLRVTVGNREFHIPPVFVTGIEHRIGQFEVEPGTDLPE